MFNSIVSLRIKFVLWRHVHDISFSFDINQNYSYLKTMKFNIAINIANFGCNKSVSNQPRTEVNQLQSLTDVHYIN